MGSIFATSCKCMGSLFDLDSIFSYSTVKIVHIRDFRLGLIHRTIQILILLYFIFYVLIISKQYAQTESAFGDSLTKLHGITRKKVSQGGGVYWTMDDAENLVYPSTENNALFIATKIYHTPTQSVGSCWYPDVDCDNDDDCTGFDDNKQISLQKGVCDHTRGICKYEEMWCPYEDHKNKARENITQIWDYEIEDFTIWVKSSILFPTLDPENVYSTIRDSKPVTKEKNPKFYNLFPVSDLLDKVEVSYYDIRDKGCILELTTNWDCDLNTWYHNPIADRCKCDYTVKRLDDPEAGSGFNFRRTVEYVDSNGKLYRDITKYMGIRMVLASKGVGSRLSIMQIILQLSSLFALLVVSTTVCDIIISYVLRRYRTAKVKETQSYLAQRKSKFDKEVEKESLDNVVGDLGLLTQFVDGISSDDDDDDEKEKDEQEIKQQQKQQIKEDDPDEKSPLLINGSNIVHVHEKEIENSLTDENSSSDNFHQDGEMNDDE